MNICHKRIKKHSNDREMEMFQKDVIEIRNFLKKIKAF